jgi:hypothetical protein
MRLAIRDPQSAFGNDFSVRHDAHVPGLFFSKAQVIAAEAELDRVAHRRTTNDLDTGAVAEAHLQQPATKVRVAADGEDAPVAPDPELVQAAGFRRAAVVTSRKTTCLLHTSYFRPWVTSKYTALRLSFNGNVFSIDKLYNRRG